MAARIPVSVDVGEGTRQADDSVDTTHTEDEGAKNDKVMETSWALMLERGSSDGSCAAMEDTAATTGCSGSCCIRKGCCIGIGPGLPIIMAGWATG